MTREAKFSVVLPNGSIKPEQFAHFTEMCAQWQMRVELPVRFDAHGNYVAGKGLTLREAQMLRRQVSSLGFNVDVVSDGSENQADGSGWREQQSSTLVVDLNEIDTELERYDEMHRSDLVSETLTSLEGMDLGLGGGGAHQPSWGGDNWMNLGHGRRESGRVAMSEGVVLKGRDSVHRENLSPVVSELSPLAPVGVDFNVESTLSADMAVLDYEGIGERGHGSEVYGSGEGSVLPKSGKVEILYSAEHAKVHPPMEREYYVEEGVNRSSLVLWVIFLVIIALIGAVVFLQYMM